MSHFIEYCPCGKMLTQCRCPSPAKEVRVSNKPCMHISEAEHPGVAHAKAMYSEHEDKLTEWQLATDSTAIYPDSFNKELSKLVYVALGLAGEAGEVADEIKKIIRNDNGIITPERKQKLKLELGDVGWYWLRAIKEAGFTVEEVMEANVVKLSKRYEHR